MNSDAVNLTEAIAASLASRAEHPFLDTPTGIVSAGEFMASVAVRRRQLAQAGIEPGARVYVATNRGADFWTDLLATWAAGATIIPLDKKGGSERALQLFQEAAPDAVLGWPDGCEVHENAKWLGPAPEKESAPSFAVARPEFPAAILFTSGSTGRPKGVVLSHKSLLGNARAAATAIGIAPEDRLFVATPFTFTSAICHFLAVALTGAVLIPRENRLFKADLFDALRASKATCFGGAPMQAQWVGECAGAQPHELRWVMSSGDHLSVATIELLNRTMPRTKIHTFYGLTELGGRFCALPPTALPAAAGAVGTPIQGLSVSVCDEQGKELPHEQEGEIYGTGDYLFEGYYGNEAETEAVLTPLGLRTGDLGYIGSDGWLRVTGRTDDVFKSSGQKVSSALIIDTLYRTGYFEDIAIVPRSHPFAGRVPWVVYVLRSGSHFDQGELLRSLRKQLPPSHLPQGFKEIDEIPRTGSGKVKRAKLREIIS